MQAEKKGGRLKTGLEAKKDGRFKKGWEAKKEWERGSQPKQGVAGQKGGGNLGGIGRQKRGWRWWWVGGRIVEWEARKVGWEAGRLKREGGQKIVGDLEVVGGCKRLEARRDLGLKEGEREAQKVAQDGSWWDTEMSGRPVEGGRLKKSGRPKKSGRLGGQGSVGVGRGALREGSERCLFPMSPVLWQGMSVICAKTRGYKLEKRKNPSHVRMNLNTHLQHLKPMKENIALNQDPAITMWLLSPGRSKQKHRGARQERYL